MDNFNKNILKGIDNLKDIGQDFAKNASGFLDTSIDTLGKTIQSVGSFAFGKDKRLNNSVLNKFKDAKLDLALEQLQVTMNTNGKTSGEELDWRVSLSIPEQIKDIIKNQKTLLDPL